MTTTPSAARRGRPTGPDGPPPLDHRALVEALWAAGCVFADDEARVLLDSAASSDELRAMLDRRVTGEPLEYVVGWVEFCNIRVLIRPGVFVPRRRTELLVAVTERLVTRGSALVELCCGTGAVSCAVIARTGIDDVTACDIDPRAVACAAANLPTARVVEADLFDGLPPRDRGRIDVVVANAPYVPTASIALMPTDARDHEPRVALDGGVDGLMIARRIVAEAPVWLAPGGTLAIETSPRQAPELRSVFAAAGFAASVVTDTDIGGCAVVGTTLGPGDTDAGP